MFLFKVEQPAGSVEPFNRVSRRGDPSRRSRPAVHIPPAKWQGLVDRRAGEGSAQRRAWARCGILALMLGLAGVTQAADGADQSLRPDRVMAALRRHTLQYGPWKSENVELRVLPFPALTLPAGPARYQVLQPTKLTNPGVHNFYLTVEIAGNEAARLWIKAEIRVFEQVVVATAPVPRQVLIGARDLRLERRETAGRSDRPFTRIEDVIGKQSTRAIAANEVLTAGAVDRPTLMKRGSVIKLVFETASLRVETSGVAEEGGKAGELIQVKNAASGRMLRGVVVDGRHVRLN